MKSIILLLGCVLLSVSGQDVIIENPILTYWGDWHEWHNCSEGQYVHGMKLMTHEYQTPLYDDTALNGIRFYCGEAGWSSIDEYVQSGIGDYGVFQLDFLCPIGQFMTGFQMRSEESQNLLDDTAGNNLRMFCNGEVNAYIQGDGLDVGVWTSARHCPTGSAICGISTQIEVSGSADDTSLNNFQAKCCPISNPAKTCEPSDAWERIQICDNTHGSSPKVCKFEKRIGVAYSHKRSNKPSERIFYNNAGYKLDNQMISELSQNIQRKMTNSKTINWEKETGFYTMEDAQIDQISIPAHSHVTLYQAVSQCGIFSASSNKFKKVLVNSLSKSETVSYITV